MAKKAMPKGSHFDDENASRKARRSDMPPKKMPKGMPKKGCK